MHIPIAVDMDVTRRWILGTAPIMVTAGCLGGEGPEAETYGDWFRNSNNYQGTQDLTDASQVTIGVGVGGGRAYGPAAARITVGTTVRWEWTGKGGQHNVLDTDGAFESVLTAEEGTRLRRLSTNQVRIDTIGHHISWPGWSGRCRSSSESYILVSK
ncbi:MAG: hypothetical protein J07HR59_01274 [Halorubrum sp. J07HR59]|nr:MAG: hypothetical protein J07HR59_01274 [Halorubrum sp. J07HR59]